MGLLALSEVASIVICLAVVFCISGAIIGGLFHWWWVSEQGPGFSAVVGLAGGILFFEVWNFVYSVNSVSVVAFSATNVLGAVLFRRTLFASIRLWYHNRSALAFIAALILLVVVSWFGLGWPGYKHYDTGLYYLNAIRWAHEYPVVPGLANLHSRLGYNQSLFLFVAFLSSLIHLGLERACQVVNPLFVFVSGWAALDRFRVNLPTAKAKRVRLYVILLFCAIFFLGSHRFICAPTSDIAAAALAIPASLAFLCCLEEIFDRNAVNARNWLLLLSICAFTMAKLKLSYIVLGGSAAGIAALVLIFNRLEKGLSFWARIAVLGAALMLPWMARGVILSGYPFFPSTFLRFHTDWAFPRAWADKERLWIYSWARVPVEAPGAPESVLKNDDWFEPWLVRNAEEPENGFLFVFVLLGLVSACLSLGIPVNRSRRLVASLLIMQTTFALIFWFKTAPDPRFGFATLLLFGVNGLFASLSAFFELSEVRANLLAGLVSVAGVCFLFDNEWGRIDVSAARFPIGFPRVEIVYKTTNTGLKVGVPKSVQMWNSDLVVTPYFDPHLALRGSNLRDGFRRSN
jgi:hypothetical protein